MAISAVGPKAAVVTKALQLPKPQGQSFDAVLKQATQPQPTPKSSPVQEVMTSIAKTENRFVAMVNKGMHSQNLSSEQLLALQTSIYTASLQIDVVSKGVEQITSGAKTLLQSQI